MLIQSAAHHTSGIQGHPSSFQSHSELCKQKGLKRSLAASLIIVPCHYILQIIVHRCCQNNINILLFCNEFSGDYKCCGDVCLFVQSRGRIASSGRDVHRL